MSKILKKYSHKYEYLKLELEEMQEKFSSFETEWKAIFGEYFNNIKNTVWINEETGEIRNEPPTEETSSPPKPEKLKKLYRKTSVKAHPDKGGNDDDFDFIKKCYESNDMLGLLSYASQNNIDFDIDEEDEELLKQSVTGVENKIKTLEISLIWNFFKGNKRMKLAVIRQLEIEHDIKIDADNILKKLESRN
jgi:hypothetical protein